MDIDKKTIAGTAAAVAAGVAGAVAYAAFGRGKRGTGGAKAKHASQGQGKRKRNAEADSASTGTININQASPAELMAVKHIGKARAKRILHARPFKSVDDVVNRGIVPADVLAPVRDRLTV